MGVRGNFRQLADAGVAQQAHGEVAPVRHPAILRRDGRLLDPLLKPAYGFVVMFLDLSLDGLEIARIRAAHPPCGGEHGGSRSGPLEKSPSIKWGRHRLS